MGVKGVMTAIDEDWELIFIDDHSTDGSLTLIRELAMEKEQIGWVSFDTNRGQQTAVLCGLRESRGELVITMDDDLEHPIEMIPELICSVRRGFDAVYAVPVRGVKAGGRFRDLFFRIVLKKPAGMRIGSYRIFTRTAADRIAAATQPFVYISAELFKHGFRSDSVEYRSEQKTTTSRYPFRARLRLYLRLLCWYLPVIGVVSRAAAAASGRPQYTVVERGGCLC